MAIKWIIWPDFIDSKHDNDEHFISAEKLMRLYQVDPLECWPIRRTHDVEFDYNELSRARRQFPHAEVLSALYHGDYLEYRKKLEAIGES